jgi:outer membrane protein TolC
VIAAALCLALAAAASAQAPKLTFDRALRIAEARSQKLAAQDASIAAAREMTVAAGQLPDPTLRVGINNLPIDGPDAWSTTADFMTMRSVSLMQEFTREAKRTARAARYEREAESARAARELELANLQRDTAIAWFDRHYQELLREALAAARDEGRLAVDAADIAYRTGRGAQADAFMARAALAQIDDRMLEASRRIATAITQLSRFVGDAAREPLAEAPPTDAVALAHADFETTLAEHPLIAVFTRQEDVAIAEAQLARANREPDVSVELMYSQRGPAYSNMVSLNVSVPLQWDRRDRQDRELAAKLAVVDRMRAEREEALRAHVAEARSMLQEWNGQRERLALYDRTLVPLAGERTQAALAAYRAGAGTLAAVLDARRGEIDARIERIRLEMEIARLWAQLSFFVPSTPHAATPVPRRKENAN